MILLLRKHSIYYIACEMHKNLLTYEFSFNQSVSRGGYNLHCESNFTKGQCKVFIILIKWIPL